MASFTKLMPEYFVLGVERLLSQGLAQFEVWTGKLWFLKILLNFSDGPATYWWPHSSVTHFHPRGLLCDAFCMISQRSTLGSQMSGALSLCVMSLSILSSALERTFWAQSYSVWITPSLCTIGGGSQTRGSGLCMWASCRAPCWGYHPNQEIPHIHISKPVAWGCSCEAFLSSIKIKHPVASY